jgi:hypothetical protein
MTIPLTKSYGFSLPVEIINQLSEVEIPFDTRLERYAGDFFAEPTNVILRQAHTFASLFYADDLWQLDRLRFNR